MRVAFVNLELGSSMNGVTNAVLGQARAAKREELPFEFIVINPIREGIEGNIRYVRYDTPRFGARSAAYTKARLLAGCAALRDKDVVLLRYPMAIDLDPLAFVRSTSARVVTVHHTMEVSELLSAGRSAGILGRAALEWWGGRRLLSRVAGVVGVTDEIRKYEVDRSGGNPPSAAIANGIDVDTVPKTGFVPFRGDALKMVFVASSRAPWHGIDRLLAGLRAYQGRCKLVLELVGGSSGAPAGTTEHAGGLTIRHHGHLRGDALDDVFRNVTLAVSSLAMFRAGLTQGCVLKTREYIARGLPFIYGYEDVDVTPGLPFAFRVSNDASPLSVEALVAFAELVSNTPDIVDRMRLYAESKLDWRIKMRAFYQFVLQVHGG